MKRLAAVLLALLMMLSSACAEGALFTASASVPVEALPDSAVIRLTITAGGELLAEAESAATASVSSLQVALAAAGAQEAEISVVRTDAQADRKFHYNKLQEPQMVLAGCSVEYVMTVRVQDLALLNALVDAAVNNGRYAAYEVEMISSASEAGYRAALEAAAKAAVEKAKALAKACGFAQTAVVSVRELPAESCDAAWAEAVVGVQ